MKTSSYIFPTLLIILGGGLLVIGAMQGQNTWVLLGAALALVTGLVSLLLVMGVITRSMGMVLGIAFGVLAVFVAWRNYRSVAGELEFTELKRENDRLVIQGLKDIRTAQLGFKDAHGIYTGDMNTLREFVRSGTIPMVRAIGQVPDTLTEKQALEMGIIVRDTILAPAMDSLFMKTKAQENRAFAFDVQKFGLQPRTAKPYILRSGSIQSSGRNVPVFVAKDPTPLVEDDTLMVGSMEKANTAGNWAGE